MAQVDCQVDPVVLWDVVDALLVLHVHCYEFIADLGCMLGVVHQTEQFVLDVALELRVVVQNDLFAFDFLAPAIFIQAFSEEYNVS